jgi:hypothetical protein
LLKQIVLKSDFFFLKKPITLPLMEIAGPPSALWNVVTVLKSIEKGRIDTCATCKNGRAV